MADNVSELSKKAAESVLSLPKSSRIRVVSHYDADGIASAGIICRALYAKGYDFHATLMRNPFTKGFERLESEENEVIIFSDMGSGQIEMIERLGCKAIILDHHQYLKSKVKQDIIQINTNLCGIDGNYEACGATLSFAFAQALDKKNEGLAPLALAGAIGDKQHIGGIRGYNKEILEGALKQGYLQQTNGLKLYGDSLSDALYFSVDPYYTGLSGNKEGIEQILEKLHIDKKIKLEALDEQKKIRLNSFLLFTLIKRGCEKNILDTIIRKRYWSDEFSCELERFADLLDACGKNRYRSLGLSLCLGDTKAFKEAEKVEKEYKQKLLDALTALEKDGVQEMNALRYFYSNDSSLGGVIGGIAMNFILDGRKPLLSLVRKDEELHISCRGNQLLVQRGLDLGDAMKNIANELGGHGGGHKIAAGATIDIEKEKVFLQKVNGIVQQQIKGIS